MDFENFLRGVRNVWDKLQALGTTCTPQEARQEVGLSHVFVLHPLDVDQPEAVRATKLGARLLHEGRIKESIRELHDARQLAPFSHIACGNLGCAYEAKNDVRAALYWYREAHRLQPVDGSVTCALALLEQRRGQAEEARHFLVTFLKEEPSHVYALRLLGRLLQRQCYWSQAAECFHRLIRTDPGNDEWPAQLQVCMDQLEMKDGLDQAEQVWRELGHSSHSLRSNHSGRENSMRSNHRSICDKEPVIQDEGRGMSKDLLQLLPPDSSQRGYCSSRSTKSSEWHSRGREGAMQSVPSTVPSTPKAVGRCLVSHQGTPCATPARSRNRDACGTPVRSRDTSQERGLTIGWNELVRPEELLLGPQLGAGGSAQVFRGSWKGQEVAVKRITGVAHLEAMKKEVDALRRLRHPRLVRFLGACVQPPLLLVVTEFMAGGSLHDRLFGRSQLAATSALGPRQRWLIACQTAEGLSFLHSQRVVHRDLKSMNILLDAGQNAKICDFGLAHQMCMESTHIARKLDGEGGSPRYMAPECYDASVGKLTEKVDIWAAGCILIELFGGILPYADCQTMPQLTARILVEKRSPDVPPGTNPQIVALIGRCVMFDPMWRMTAKELQSALARLR